MHLQILCSNELKQLQLYDISERYHFLGNLGRKELVFLIYSRYSGLVRYFFSNKGIPETFKSSVVIMIGLKTAIQPH